MLIHINEDGNLTIPGSYVEKLGESMHFQCLLEDGRLIILPSVEKNCQPADKKKTEYREARELNVRCFGRFAVSYHGKEQDIHINSSKAREFLAYLVCCQGEAVPKRAVCEALWGDISEKCSQDSLYKLIKKVRSLPLPLKIEDKRGFLRLDMGNIESDLGRFNNLLRDKENKENLKEAVGLYCGSLLGRENYGWVGMMEADYDRRYLEALLDLKKYYEEKQDIHTAAVYRRLLKEYI